MHNRMWIVTVFIAAATILSMQEKAFAEDAPAAMDNIVRQLRPYVEFQADESRDPFEDLLDNVEIEEGPSVAAVEIMKERPELPYFDIQGIIWGGTVPCVIINNKVFKEGESFDEIKIIKIGKQGVDVLYNGWEYKCPSPAKSLEKRTKEAIK